MIGLMNVGQFVEWESAVETELGLVVENLPKFHFVRH
jgi:hypothetical protein